MAGHRSKSLYEDCYHWLDRAHLGETVILKFTNYSTVFNTLQRIDAAIHRHRNIYGQGEEMSGQSVYDRLLIQASRLDNTITIKPREPAQ